VPFAPAAGFVAIAQGAKLQRLRILVASPFLPSPGATHGGGVYLGALLTALAREADVGLVSFVRPSELRWRDVPSAGIALSRTIELPSNYDLSPAAKAIHKLHMAWRWGVQGLPLLAAKYRSRAMSEELRRTTAEFQPDAVFVEFGIMAQYLSCFAGVPTVLTDHEHGATPHQAVFFGLGQGRDKRLWDRYIRKHYRLATLVQALNEDDATRLSTQVGKPVEIRTPVVPLPHDTVDPRLARPRALFLGDYTHRPNPETACFLAQQVWPIVRRHMNDAELVLAGPRANAEVKDLAKLPGVSFVGFVPDLKALVGDARLLLAPMFSGSGSRIKVLTALAHGLPVVSNSLRRTGTVSKRSCSTVSAQPSD